MRLILLIAVLAFATLLGIGIRQNPGYALFAFKDWTVEMPLWLAGFFFVGLFAVTFLIASSVYFMLTSSKRIKHWWLVRQQYQARKQLERGLLELAEGRYKKAEAYLGNSARYSDVPLIHYLSAAKAAEEINEPAKRDKYLALAHNVSGGSDIAVRLTEAQLRFQQGDLEHSVATLQHLHAEQPKHPQVLKLLCTLYEAMQDWHSLFSLLPELKKADIFPNPGELARLEQTIYQALLPEFSKKGKKVLQQLWRSAPDSVQSHPKCLILYCQGLIENHAEPEAEEVLRTYLKRAWHPELITLYGKISMPSANKQLEFAESKLDTHSEDAFLYLTLGRLALKQKLWGKAREYLEHSLMLAEFPETYALLAQLMEELEQEEKAQAYYKKGLLNLVEDI